MRKINSAVAAISGIFGFIAFAITAFLVPPWLALLFGLFTMGMFIAGISIVLVINDRKYKGIDSEVTGEILLKETANYYEGKRIQNGLLVLTPSRLLFISREKRQELRWDMPIEEIDDTAYGKNSLSFVVTTSDGNMAGFVVNNPETFIEKIDCLRNGKKGIYINEKALNYIYACNNEITTLASGESVTLTRTDLGLLNLPTGKIVANDPCVFFETDKFTTSVKPGSYPVSIFVAKLPGGDRRIALAMLTFSGEKAVRWEMALVKDQSIDGLRDEGYFGYGVDSGTGGFMDKQTADRISERGLDVYELFQAQFEATYVHTYNYAIGGIDGGSDNDVAAFSSGWGDGCYPSYFGFDEDGEPCVLVTDFLALD